MPRILSLHPVSSIKVGPLSTVAPDGTIINPVPYEGVNVIFDDGVTVQVERPLTLAKITAAYRAAVAPAGSAIDGGAPGAVITP